MTSAGQFRPSALVPGFDFSLEHGVGILRLSWTDKRNALSREMWSALPAILAEIDADPGIHALIITGSGGHFSAGSDIADLNVALDDFWSINAAAEAAIADADIPTIAAIEGTCVGGGTEIAAACDIRIGAPSSIYGVTAAKLGLVYPPVPTRRLCSVVGEPFARYLLLTARIVDFDEMKSHGFFHATGPDPLAIARETAVLLGSRSQLTQTAVKRILRGEALDPRPGSYIAHAYGTEIVKGQEAFRNRTSPEFETTRVQFPSADT